MDSENAPLLLNDENTANVAHTDQSNAGRSQAGHLCSSCSGKMDPQKTTLRHVLIFAAFLWCIMIFSLLVAHMVIGERPNVITVFVAIWTHVTLAVLIVLLLMGRRRYSHHKLGRTVTQIRVLCALGSSWLLLLAGVVTLHPNSDAMCYPGGGYYNYRHGDCRRLFKTAHGFSWILTVTLFSAAYATYHRAVALHGTALVVPPPPPMVPAWRLSTVADKEGPLSEGTLKI
ncbi:hypothetical protein K438DRAFT_921799 [Mycena galopus ATCC 62051]|nr:hypothetical protein K438DRAFT_921799 [Mycena galopus ATCC 62051]